MIRGHEVKAQEMTTEFIHTRELVRVNLCPHKPQNLNDGALMKNMLKFRILIRHQGKTQQFNRILLLCVCVCVCACDCID